VSFFTHLKTSLASKFEGVSTISQLFYQEEQVQTGVSDEAPSPLYSLEDVHPMTKTEKEDEPSLPESPQLPKVPKKVRFDALVEARLEALVEARRLQSLLEMEMEMELAQSSESFMRSEDAYRSATYDVDLFHSSGSLSLEGSIENDLKCLSPQAFLVAESTEEDEHFGYHVSTCSSQDSDLAIAGWSFSLPTKDIVADAPTDYTMGARREPIKIGAATSDEERRIHSYRSTSWTKKPGMQEFMKNPMTKIPQTQSHTCRPSENMPLVEQSSNALNRRLDTPHLSYRNARATMASEATTDVSEGPVKISKTKPTSTITPMERMRIMQLRKHQG
jgi:hypothetical protein